MFTCQICYILETIFYQ